MGFLKRSNAPSELPNLAIDSLGDNIPKGVVASPTQPLPVQQPIAPQQPVVPLVPAPIISTPTTVTSATAPILEKKPIAGEDYLEFEHKDTPLNPVHESIKKVIDNDITKDNSFSKSSFFDEVLEDINGGIADVSKLEDWYEKKFVNDDVISNMKGYWEGNKADIIIQSFGAEYKRQINDKIQTLRGLEEDWREIYFRLIKKEEEMKKEERELKETLSEFVNLCKRRKNGEEKGSEKNK
jgi:hypothetical protein